MTLNTQQGGKSPVRRRASTPVPLSHQSRPAMRGPRPNPIESQHPPLGFSSSFDRGDKAPVPRGSWSSDSADSDSSWESLYRVVLLGDPGVGKTSLVNLFAGIQEKDLPEQQGEDMYERTLSVDGEETTLLVMDTWEPEKRPQEEESGSHHDCLQVGNAYVIVYSITDRASFESASELRIQLRRTRQAENIPIILVGNKTDLVRRREVSVEGQIQTDSTASCLLQIYPAGRGSESAPAGLLRYSLSRPPERAAVQPAGCWCKVLSSQ
ncbi:GTP-binding protein REM 1 isoform X2 [Emydura macquarii macquarii]|uniref:GTP-binding protein REM 1 isoform X2 n=1 Tax=Emydura macquarii macquarii TaxID=1129001 RepID=UPI00352B5F59